MSQPAASPAAQAFFLPAAPGQRYCLYHAPAGACRGALLYLAPFAEEMNKSRRMATAQARLLAGLGYAVLQPDLYGCGDSSGDFGDARWDIWLRDLALARDWLQQRSGMAADLWGLRLGGLLALDFLAREAQPPSRLLLWQPVTEGAAYLQQFLRLRLARDMQEAGAPGSAAALRQRLLAGEALEVGGYLLDPALAAAIEACDAASLAPAGVAVDWFEQAAPSGRAWPARRQAVLDVWRARGVAPRLHSWSGPAFWASQEIAACPQLLAATAAALGAGAALDCA